MVTKPLSKRPVKVWDLETTVKGTKDWPANPYHADNHVVASAYCASDGTDSHVDYLNDRIAKMEVRPQHCGIVGHNLSFDLAYLRRFGTVTKTDYSIDVWLKDQFVWDTMIAEYILTGQIHLYPSLNDLSVKYGGVLKDDKIKKYWDTGVQTEDIPAAELIEYARNDVLNTAKVYQGQLALAEKNLQTPLILAMCKAMVAFSEIQFNGLEIDVKKLAELSAAYESMIGVQEAVLAVKLNRVELANGLPLGHLSYTSPKDLSAILFGGNVEVTTKELVGKFKNGNDKYKNVTQVKTLKSGLNPRDFTTETKNPGVYSVSEDVLEKVVRVYKAAGSAASMSHVHDIANGVLRLRTLNKTKSTYIDGIAANCKRNTYDHRVHADYNMAATSTGRLSSSNPNMQNIPQDGESPIKEVFISRWGDDGVIIEADYKQLEVITLAYVSGCKSLIKDIFDGVDIHTGLGMTLYGPHYTMTKEERRVIKTINFGLIFGGQPKSLAEQAGVSVPFATQAVEAFYKRYPGVKEWHDSLINKAQSNCVLTDKRTPTGQQVHKYTQRSVTGRYYYYYTEDNDYRPGQTRWPITKMKNYPVQGLATGDIVPTMVGILYDVLKSNAKLARSCLMVNQVHDSIMFDCRKDVLNEALHVIRETLEDAPRIISHIYNIKFELPLKVTVSVGPNWKDVKEIE